jgi:hypothetical protein
MFITVFKRARHWSYPEPYQSRSYNPTLFFILIFWRMWPLAKQRLGKRRLKAGITKNRSRSPFLGNGSLAHILAATNINKDIPVTTGDWQLTLRGGGRYSSFRSYKRKFLREFSSVSRKKLQKAVHYLSVQLWSVNLRATEAEEITDS